MVEQDGSTTGPEPRDPAPGVRAADVIREERLRGRIEPLARAASIMEASVIAALMRRLGLSTYVDLGCWTGILLSEVVRQAAPRRILAVDAVPELLAVARERCPDPRVTFECVTLVPRDGRVADRRFRMPLGDTSSAGLLVEDGIDVETGPREGLRAFLRTRVPVVADAYLKLDVEGLDATFVVELLTEGLEFPVIHFEVLPWHDASAATAALRQHGYVVPTLAGTHRFYSLACSRSGGVLMGFCPNVVYPPIAG